MNMGFSLLFQSSICTDIFHCILVFPVYTNFLLNKIIGSICSISSVIFRQLKGLSIRCDVMHEPCLGLNIVPFVLVQGHNRRFRF